MAEREIPVLTVRELEKYLHCHRSSIYRLLKLGEIPAFKIGSDWRFNKEEIDRWMRKKTAEQAGRGS